MNRRQRAPCTRTRPRAYGLGPLCAKVIELWRYDPVFVGGVRRWARKGDWGRAPQRHTFVSQYMK
jgi:hypothetical protein